MTRVKRDFGTIRRRANGRYQAFYMGPDQGFHRAPSTFRQGTHRCPTICSAQDAAEQLESGGVGQDPQRSGHQSSVLPLQSPRGFVGR